jgi:hypothetical protein
VTDTGCIVIDMILQECCTDSRGVFSVGGHVLARILGQAVVKMAEIRFNNSICASLVLICACHSSAAMPCRPEEASLLQPLCEQKGLLGPNGDWLSRRACQNQAGFVAVASPVVQQNFDGLTGS